MRRPFLTTVAFLLGALPAVSSSATEIAYTLNDPPGSAPFTAGSLTGTVDPFSGVLVDTDAICLDGTCTLASQDWIVFTVTVTAGSLNDVGVGALFEGSLGLGYFVQGGPIQDGTGGTDLYTGDATSNPNVPVFTFAGSGGGGLTGTSLPLFVTYANGSLPTPAGPFGEGATQFMITEFGGAGIDSPIENVTQTLDIVPEPATAFLLGIGFVSLGILSRNRPS